jgi:hypothetical protein
MTNQIANKYQIQILYVVISYIDQKSRTHKKIASDEFQKLVMKLMNNQNCRQ